METLPLNAQQYLPVLIAEVREHWPSMPLPSALAAQVEQETCSKLTSPRCWSPHAELKTQREYGFGLGQLTMTSRFNRFEDAKELDVSLKTWQWSQRYDPQKQLRALVLMDKGLFHYFDAATLLDQLAFMFSAYNGGIAGVRNDKKLCGQIEGCDALRWFGHVEKHSLKQRTKVSGYGQSFYDINRTYVRNVLKVRRSKYIAYMDGDS
jgi:hypothetical protein